MKKLSFFNSISSRCNAVFTHYLTLITVMVGGMARSRLGHHHGHHHHHDYYPQPQINYYPAPQINYYPQPQVNYYQRQAQYSPDPRSHQGLAGGVIGSVFGYELGSGDPLATGLGAAAGSFLGNGMSGGYGR